jgi:hypothetical protein
MGTPIGVPKALQVLSKAAVITRTMTSATNILKIPKGNVIVGMTLIGTASDATTSAALSIGNTAATNTYVNGRDVKTAGTGTGCMPLTIAVDTRAALTIDENITALFTQTGAGTAGGWILKVDYVQIAP